MWNDWDYLKESRDKLLSLYKFDFNKGYRNGSTSPVYIRTLNSYFKLQNGESYNQFEDAGIRYVLGKKSHSKKIKERGYFEMFTPSFGLALPITKKVIAKPKSSKDVDFEKSTQLELF